MGQIKYSATQFRHIINHQIPHNILTLFYAEYYHKAEWTKGRQTKGQQKRWTQHKAYFAKGRQTKTPTPMKLPQLHFSNVMPKHQSVLGCINTTRNGIKCYIKCFKVQRIKN